jgi:NCS1 family nucleobase:cation symporter-1
MRRQFIEQPSIDYVPLAEAYIGFNAFNQILAAQTAHTLYGFDSKRTIMLGFTLVSLILAVVGYDLIHVAQRWTAYVLIAARVRGGVHRCVPLA